MYEYPESHQLDAEPHPPCKARARARNYLLLTIVLFWLCMLAGYAALTGEKVW